MKILGNFAIVFYTAVCLILGILLVLLAFNAFPLTMLGDVAGLIYTTQNIRLILGVVGIGIVLISLLIAQLTSGKIQRERTIAFENPDGQVMISLSAIEDLIKRVGRQMPEIKDIRPSVIAGKKGVNIVNRIVLFAGTNIPEVTEKMQNVVKVKVQEMLGIEEPITIKIHVTKISSHEKQKEEREEREERPHVFKGIEYSSD